MGNTASEKGFTLLEVMVTLFLVALISSSLMGGFVISQRMLQRAERVTQASNFAYHILENLRACPAQKWAQLADESPDDHLLLFYGGDECRVNLQAAVSLEESIYIPNLYSVKVVVGWQDDKEVRSLEMVTFLSSFPGGSAE